jgi:hypothetical protein
MLLGATTPRSAAKKYRCDRRATELRGKFRKLLQLAAWPGKHFGMFTAGRAAGRIRATIVVVTTIVVAAIWLSVPSSPMARDFEECAGWAQTIPPGTERIARIMDCGARFAGRRKAGGGYAYYDLLQNRSFDIAGPNPTADERTRIYSEYIHFLGSQRRQAALAELEYPAAEEPQATAPVNSRSPTAKPSTSKPCMVKGSLSCTWVKLTSTVRNALASNAKVQAMDNSR